MQKTKRLPFTEQENQIIKDSVKIMGEDWEAISKKLPGRTPKQCHDRYINYLREGLKCDPWSPQEDETLLTMYKTIGPKWSRMMSNLPGRSGNDIKNRWHKHLIKKPNQLYNMINANYNNNIMTTFNEIPGTRSYPYFSIQNTQTFNLITNYQPQMITNFQEQLKIPKESFPQTKSETSLTPSPINGFSSKREERADLDSELSFFDQSHLNDYFDGFFDQNSEKLSNQPSSETQQNHPPVRIINKVELTSNNLTKNNKDSQNQQSNLSSEIGWNDFEIQDILENLNYIDLDFY